jgi:hypothetical protein
MRGSLRNARETVDACTPARWAISRIVLGGAGMLKKNGSNSVGLNSGRTNVREARRHSAIGQRDGGNEHRLRPHPKTTVAVEHFINDEDFL